MSSPQTEQQSVLMWLFPAASQASGFRCWCDVKHLIQYSVEWMDLTWPPSDVSAAESSLCDWGASLSQLWGVLHSPGPHHWSGGQQQRTVTWFLALCYCLWLCVNSSRLALSLWWSFPMWASCLEAGPQSCGTTSWPMSRGWADTVTKC